MSGSCTNCSERGDLETCQAKTLFIHENSVASVAQKRLTKISLTTQKIDKRAASTESQHEQLAARLEGLESVPGCLFMGQGRHQTSSRRPRQPPWPAMGSPWLNRPSRLVSRVRSSASRHMPAASLAAGCPPVPPLMSFFESELFCKNCGGQLEVMPSCRSLPVVIQASNRPADFSQTAVPSPNPPWPPGALPRDGPLSLFAPAPMSTCPSPWPVTAFLGLGALGQRMAVRALGAGVPLRVHRRNRAREEPQRALGSVCAASPAAAARQAEILCLCLSDDDPVTGGREGGRAGSLSMLVGGAAAHPGRQRRLRLGSALSRRPGRLGAGGLPARGSASAAAARSGAGAGLRAGP